MRNTLAALASTAILVTVGLAAPAQAAAPIPNHVAYSGTETFSDCGFDGFSTFSGTTTILDTNPALSGQFFRLTNAYQFRDTLTNPDTGDYVVITGRGVFKELQPRTTDGRNFTYISHDVGRLSISDSSGQVLVKESGVITFSYVFDTLGDGEPGGIGTDGDLVRLSGPHETWDADFDFCSLISDATS